MIDAYQATSVAITTEDGGIYHDRHFQDEFDRLWEIANAEAEAEGERRYGRLAEQIYDELKAEAGLHSVIRYTIHEMEAEKAWDVEQHPEYYSEDLVALIERRDALSVALTKLNAAPDDPEAEDAADVVYDMISDLNREIEDMVDLLSKVYCDECGEPIE